MHVIKKIDNLSSFYEAIKLSGLYEDPDFPLHKKMEHCTVFAVSIVCNT